MSYCCTSPSIFGGILHTKTATLFPGAEEVLDQELKRLAHIYQLNQVQVGPSLVRAPEWHLWLAYAVNRSCFAARDSSGTSPGGSEPLGPHCPDWIRQASDQAEEVTNRLQSPGSKHQSRNDANLSTKPKGASKHKKDKSHKKARTKKRHKHKHNKL